MAGTLFEKDSEAFSDLARQMPQLISGLPWVPAGRVLAYVLCICWPCGINWNCCHQTDVEQDNKCLIHVKITQKFSTYDG